MNTELQNKVNFALRLLRTIPTDNGPVEISYSGGKDSDVILDLAKDVALKVANKYNDPEQAAEYAVKFAKSVVGGLKRK